MQVIRSAKVRFQHINVGKVKAVHALMDEYAAVCNAYVRLFWEMGELPAIHRVSTELVNSILHPWFTYRIKRVAADEALSLVIAARACASRVCQAPVIPIHNGKVMRLNTLVVGIEDCTGCFDFVVVIKWVGKRMKLTLPFNRHYHMNRFLQEGWTQLTSVSVFRDHIQLFFSKEVGKVGGRAALGADVGINKLVVTSDGAQYGVQTKDLIAKVRRKQFKSKSYYRAKTQLKEYINVTIKQMFDAHPSIGVFVFENLKGLKQGRKGRSASFRKVLHNWNYRYLLDYARRQTEVRRSCFRSVSPYNTSRTCPACSHVEKGNRVNEQFHCLSCGYAEDADVVGAMNIVTRFTTGKYGSGFKAVLP